MPTSRYTHQMLDAAGRRGDPDADDVIRAHVAATGDTPAQVIDDIVGYLTFAPRRRSQAIQDYLDAEVEPAIAVEPEVLARGSQFFLHHALEIAAALFLGSLPMSYASPRGARTLTITGQLTDHASRRIHETAQMVLNTMATDALAPGNAGYDDLRRVRLMHAAVRHFIECDPSVPHVEHLPVKAHGWCDGWGVPLNQEDMLGGLLTFTVTVLDVLDRLGVRYVAEEAEAYVRLWCAAGSLMGVDPTLLPADRDEAQEAANLIEQRQLDASADGRRLTAALIAAVDDALDRSMFRPVRGTVPATIRWFVGPEIGGLLGVDPSLWEPILKGPVHLVSKVVHTDERHGTLSRTLLRALGAAAVRGFMGSTRPGERPAFTIPEEMDRTFARGPAGYHLPSAATLRPGGRRRHR